MIQLIGFVRRSFTVPRKTRFSRDCQHSIENTVTEKIVRVFAVSIVSSGIEAMHVSMQGKLSLRQQQPVDQDISRFLQHTVGVIIAVFILFGCFKFRIILV